MKPALPTVPVTYGLNGPSATATVDNATPAGLHLSTRKSCPNKWDQLYQQHLEPAHGIYRVRDIGRQQQAIALFQCMANAC